MIDYNNLGNMLELQDWELEDTEYMDYLLVDYIQDWLLNNNYNGKPELSSYLYDKVYDIDRLEYIGDYVTDGIVYNRFENLVEDILNNVLDNIEPIADIAADYNISIYDVIHGIDDALLIHDGYNWHIVSINYGNDTFNIGDITYNLNDIIRRDNIWI